MLISASSGQSAGSGANDGTAGGSAGKPEEPDLSTCADSVRFTCQYVSAAGHPGDSSSADSSGNFHDSSNITSIKSRDSAFSPHCVQSEVKPDY